MIVYIEQVVIDNMVVNFFLLWFCCLVLKEKKSLPRFLLASAVGTAFAMVFPLFEITTSALVFLKTLLCVLIILIAFKFNSIKNLAKNCLVFLVSTFLLGGIVVGFLVNIFASYTIENGTLSYISSVPIGMIILFGFVVFKVFYDIILLAKNKSKLERVTFELSVFYQGKITTIKAFLDTGNLLLDGKTQTPIIVINFKAFKQILNISSEQFLLGEYMIESKRYQNYHTANKESKMLVFDVEKVCIKVTGQTKVILNAVLGLAANNFSDKLNCDALIGLNHIEIGE